LSAKIDLSTAFADSFHTWAISWPIIDDIGWPGPCTLVRVLPGNREAAVGVEFDLLFGCFFVFGCCLGIGIGIGVGVGVCVDAGVCVDTEDTPSLVTACVMCFHVCVGVQ
jgi:hypothetical protein